MASASGNCGDARNLETSVSRLSRSTGIEGPWSSRAASISGRPTFLKFQTYSSRSRSTCSGQPSGRSGRLRRSMAARRMTRHKQSQRGRSSIMKASVRGSRISKVHDAKLPSLIQASPRCASVTRARNSARLALSTLANSARHRDARPAVRAVVRAFAPGSISRCRSSRQLRYVEAAFPISGARLVGKPTQMPRQRNFRHAGAARRRVVTEDRSAIRPLPPALTGVSRKGSKACPKIAFERKAKDGLSKIQGNRYRPRRPIIC